MSLGQGTYLKITYHGGSKPISSYLQMPSPTWSVLKREIALSLFEERKQPRCEVRTYWIDEDRDEIEIVNQCDYDIFRAKRSERQHLQVAPINETSPSAFVIHERVECDGCDAAPIVGFRYKCIQCPNFDLCERCEAQHKHSEHMMVRMPLENCPSVIEAWVGERSSGRRSSKRSKGGFCPFVAETPMHAFAGTVPKASQATAGDAAAQPDGKDHHHHHGRNKHHRRQMRHGIFSHIYDIMQDLAEGGAATATAAKDATKATDGAAGTSNHEAASKAAEEAAKLAHSAAMKAAEAANEAAALTAQNIAAACPGFTFPPTAPEAATAEAKEKEPKAKPDTTHTPPPTPDTTAPNTAEPEIKKTQDTNTNTATPILNSHSFENLAQLVDPQYMKAGIQILNNFSEMFAKMLDPTDEGGAACPLQSAAFQPRKNSTSSTASSNMSSSTTSKNTTIERPFNENIIENNAERNKRDAAPAQTAPTPDKAIGEQQAAAATIAITPIATSPVSAAQSPERRRSQSEEGDWQMIDTQATPNSSFSTVSTSTSTESVDGAIAVTAAPTASIVNELNYEQLSKDLKAHVEQEQKREQELKEQQTLAAGAVGVAMESAPAAVAAAATVAQPKAPEEKRAVPVYHSDQNINNAVHAMMAMGFSNEGAWLTQLLESVNGNIPEALDLMSAAQRNNN